MEICRYENAVLIKSNTSSCTKSYIMFELLKIVMNNINEFTIQCKNVKIKFFYNRFWFTIFRIFSSFYAVQILFETINPN